MEYDAFVLVPREVQRFRREEKPLRGKASPAECVYICMRYQFKVCSK